ncbi:MAG TPA: ATPase domain-containing protein [Actinomycetota bacterium]|nr:ATPase domain-containing protein [Actinomycetota bacterium]
MARTRTTYACRDCGQQTAQWVGRCPGCGAWGTLDERRGAASDGSATSSVVPVPLASGDGDGDGERLSTGVAGLDRVLGGGLVPASVALLAGEPGIGKSTLLLQMLGRLAAGGRACMLAAGEESHAQISARAGRLGIDASGVSFIPGRDLAEVLAAAAAERPDVLAVDSIQTIRDVAASHLPGGVSQVRTCADALVGFAKAHGVTVMITGHVTKEGDLAGPRALEHAVDVVLTFDGDARSGLRVLAGGKNRFGTEGESAWFEMTPAGLRELDPTGLLAPGDHVAGAAVALPQMGRRSVAVEVQALVGAPDGPARRQATGLDARRFSLVAAVLDRAAGLRIGRSELFGATSGGARVDDPACDLAVAAALASAATGTPPPDGAAFVGEVALTGLVRPAPAMAQRAAAARAAGRSVLFAPDGPSASLDGLRVVRVRHVGEALSWALRPVETRLRDRSA